MSEYQFYHFQALDRPLSAKQMQELRDISTRADITPSSFINVYNWGDLKADPRDLMRRYFDAHVYTANWGTHRFMLKIPRAVLDLDHAELYGSEALAISVSKDHVMLDFVSEDDSGDFDDDMESDEGWMAALLPLREELMRGDLRALYVGWLANICEDDDTEEPPLPPGMHQLTAPLKRLADFLRVDEHLLRAAQQGDSQPALHAPSRADMSVWIAAMPSSEKDHVLLSLLSDDADTRHLSGRLRQQFYQTWRQTHPTPLATTPKRTASHLWQTRTELAEAERRRQAEKEARQRAVREKHAAEQRRQYLASLADREASVWQEVTALLSTTVPKNYDEAVRLLGDLRDVAANQGKEEQWAARVTTFRQHYARKPSLMQRFTKAGFP
jgi:hypothetical protein